MPRKSKQIIDSSLEHIGGDYTLTLIEPGADVAMQTNFFRLYHTPMHTDVFTPVKSKKRKRIQITKARDEKYSRLQGDVDLDKTVVDEDGDQSEEETEPLLDLVNREAQGDSIPLRAYNVSVNRRLGAAAVLRVHEIQAGDTIAVVDKNPNGKGSIRLQVVEVFEGNAKSFRTAMQNGRATSWRGGNSGKRSNASVLLCYEL